MRYPGKGAEVFAWLGDGATDTSSRGRPPNRCASARPTPRESSNSRTCPAAAPSRICALYDRDADRSFDPGDDRWTCLNAPLVVPDTGRVVTGIDLYLAEDDEPGTMAPRGCSPTPPACTLNMGQKVLQGARAHRDSLRSWLNGRTDTPPSGLGHLEGLESRGDAADKEQPGAGSRSPGRGGLHRGRNLRAFGGGLAPGRARLPAPVDSLEAVAKEESTLLRPLRGPPDAGDTTLRAGVEGGPVLLERRARGDLPASPDSGTSTGTDGPTTGNHRSRGPRPSSCCRCESSTT